jgi:hypothetical protein
MLNQTTQGSTDVFDSLMNLEREMNLVLLIYSWIYVLLI